ncbi:hypothetical protein HK103_007022 [Boothiomyces macroporosus]|uniref:Uncharacterized protein n=1 Tax=Boothiomyces macroporosus TaxID=261099 RepID=A0AAD5UD43_9FUNG|nr:hypothetical protein HK103_007022 [Boothiomyces macroporosus]
MSVNLESEVLEQTIQNLTESNQRLEAENTLLQLKNNLLLDMVPIEDHSVADEEHLFIDQQAQEHYEISPEEEAELLNMEIPKQEPTEIQPEIVVEQTRIHINEHDGVFSNMAAKPTALTVKDFEEIEPPSYHDAVVDPAPEYYVNCVDENGEILIEGNSSLIPGLPVGDYFIYLINVFLSLTFDILGFFLTTLLATSHAARFGSQAGLGLTLMRYGVLVKQKVDENDFPPVEYDNGYQPDPEEEKSRREWSAVFIIFMGLFILLRANIEFFRLRRMRSLVGASAYPI